MTITLLCGLKDEARIFLDTPGLQVLCGPAARDGLTDLISADCTALISSGCAGALTPDLAIGDLVVATKVVFAPGAEYIPTPWWSDMIRALTGAIGRPVFSCPTEQAPTPEARASLAAQFGVDVADEESYAVAQLATMHKLPFLVLRAISDTADQTLLPDDAKAQRRDGSEDVWPIIGDAIRNPREAIRETEGFLASLRALRKAFAIVRPTWGLPI